MTTRRHFAKYLERGAKIIVTAMPVGIAFLIVLLASLWATTPQAHSFKPQIAENQKEAQTAYPLGIEPIALSLAAFERPRFDKKPITATSERLDSKLEALSKQPRSALTPNPSPNNGRGEASGTCIVTTIFDSGAGSLRQCLLDVGPNATIDFELPPDFPSIILLLSPLPSITTDGLTIDGAGFSPMISGFLLGGTGLVIDGADGVTIRGLQIMNFPEHGIELKGGTTNTVIGGDTPDARNVISGNMLTGIWIHDDGTSNNQILGNYIGTDATGMDALGNEWGVGIGFGAQNNIIGGEAEGARNLISGNTESGIQMQNVGTSGNQVLGNYIGTDATGEAALGNYGGIVLMLGAKNNDIGGETEASRNIISGNGRGGIFFGGGGINISGEGTTGNRILGNYIGTDVDGTQAISNYGGILIDEGASQNVIGGANEAARNLISGNGMASMIEGHEIAIIDEGSSENQIQGNYIGTDVTGTQALTNKLAKQALNGITIAEGASQNLIGGAHEGAGNLISGKTGGGVVIFGQGTSLNQVLGNRIGTDVLGQVKIPNLVGVGIGEGATDNVIGDSGAGNLISGNQIGVEIVNQGTEGNQILGNYIGTDVTGTERLGNEMVGLALRQQAQNNVIGEIADPDSRNIISGNNGPGVYLEDSGTSGNQIFGNYIGTDVTGTEPVSNTVGVGIGDSATNNIIGGAGLARNIISGNSEGGITIQEDGTTGNQVIGNYIGTDVTGFQPLKNGVLGIGIVEGASDNVVGSSTAPNLISGNGRGGVYLAGENTTGNQIVGNLIGTDADGELAIPNEEVGIHIDSAKDNTIGINNTIAYNGEVGIRLEILANGTPPSGNTITRNIIYQNNGPPIEWMDIESILAPPTLKSYSDSDNVLAGTACANCLVEIFASQSHEPPEGRVFLGEVTADPNGEFTFTLNEPPLGYLSATATDSEGNTSEFSSALELKPIGGTATPTATATASPTITATATSTATPTPFPNGLNYLYLPVITR